MPDPTPLQAPGGYSLLRKLGSGQTAHVYLAQHETRGKVAVKLPREELADKPVLRRMFENEVQITLKLQHPNVVAGYDGVPTGSSAYLVLEYCSGGTLGELLMNMPKVPLQRARALIVDVARGLEHSHSRQVLHRDVKPANVFLTGDGTAKLGDFGTGMHIGDENRERVGTAFYMAPEIFEGQAPTVQSDIYSLGVLAYEVMAGVRPFQGGSYEDLMMAHLTSFPKALASQREDLGRGEAKVIATAMARDSARRYRSVQEFRQAFMAASGMPEPERPAPEVTGRASRRAKAPDVNEAAAGNGGGSSGGSGGKDEAGSKGRSGAKGEKGRSSGIFGWFRRKRED